MLLNTCFCSGEARIAKIVSLLSTVEVRVTRSWLEICARQGRDAKCSDWLAISFRRDWRVEVADADANANANADVDVFSQSPVS